MDGLRDDHEFLVVRILAVFDHIGIGVTRKIAGMRLVAVDQEDCAADLIGVLKDRLIDKGLTADDVPAAVGIQGTGMVAASGLVVIVVVLHKERRVLRQRIDHTASEPVFTGLQVQKSLGTHSGLRLVTGFLTVSGIEIPLGIHTGHVVHGGGHGRLDPGVQCRCIDGHAAPAADSDDADAVRIDFFMEGEEVYCSHKVFGVDVRGGHVTHIAAALTGEGRIKSNRQKSSLCHGLCVQAGALFLDCAERAGNCDRRKLSLRFLRHIHICRQRNAIAVHKCHLAVIDFFAFGEGLIPFVCEYEFFFSDHGPGLLIS